MDDEYLTFGELTTYVSEQTKKSVAEDCGCAQTPNLQFDGDLSFHLVEGLVPPPAPFWQAFRDATSRVGARLLVFFPLALVVLTYLCYRKYRGYKTLFVDESSRLVGLVVVTFVVALLLSWASLLVFWP